MPRRGGADALQRVRAPAELLQDGVVRDRAQFARMPDTRRSHHAIRLPRCGPRSGHIDQRRTERAEQRGIARVVDQRLHAGAHGGEEVGGEVGIGVDRILDRTRRRMVGLLRDAGDRRQRQFRRAEQQIAVAALERGLLAHAEPGAVQRLTRRGWRQVFQPIGQRTGMRAAPHALAVRVEQDHLDVRDTVIRQRLADLQPQPLDQVTRGKLADISAGIRIAELQRQSTGRLQIGAIVGAAQRLLQHRRAVLQRVRGLEQRADLDMPLDAEQPRQPQRGEQRVAGLGLGDQEAHRHGAVHVLDDLRDGHHQPDRRCLLGQQSAKINGDRLHRTKRHIHRAEQHAAMRRDPRARRRCPTAGAPRCGSAPH